VPKKPAEPDLIFPANPTMGIESVRAYLKQADAQEEQFIKFLEEKK